ncbi:hypothetical protein ILUMI_03302 [Ignelater luminosus]|uniref:PiggyBac transposable element-derived protein domain-containing protein n=1 Tax=Ignelater luminosus TaxID=2038154 RepID=A0A8K0GKK4_IGNLU|nr:hypothetical protein ILUMI_03302 [Ignelater luminosus]
MTKELETSTFGTILKNKLELPQKLVTTRGRDVYSTKFGYQDKVMLASYWPKKEKIATLLPIVHDSGQISETEKKKMQMIIDYNKTKSGVDTMHKLARTYIVKRKTRRWSVTVFYNMIDISVLNAYIIWRHLNEDWRIKKGYKRREFLMQLGKKLVVTRKSTEKATSQSHPQETQKLKRGRCWKCSRNLDRKYSKRCQNCNRFVCNVPQKLPAMNVNLTIRNPVTIL